MKGSGKLATNFLNCLKDRLNVNINTVHGSFLESGNEVRKHNNQVTICDNITSDNMFAPSCVDDAQNESYDKLLLVGDFNAEEKESCFNVFLYQYGMANIVKQVTCFKKPLKPSCIDLFLTSNP